MPKTPAQAKVLPPPEWLYDRIMLAIEPELTTAQMQHLDELYADETSEEYEDRMQRYAKAFQIFQTLLADFGDYLFEQSRAVTNERRRKRAKEEEDTGNIAKDIFGSDA